MNSTNEPEAWAKARQSLAQVAAPTAMAYQYLASQQVPSYPATNYVPNG